MNKKDKNKKVFWILIFISIACQAIITPFLLGDIQLILNWISIGFYGFFGYLGLKYFEKKSGFPEMLQKDIRFNQRILFPLLFGIVFAVAAIVSDIISPTKIPQIAFPLSILVWIPIAILDEMFWRLFVLTSLICLVNNKILKGKHREKVIWGVAIFESLIYMFIQFSLYSKMVGIITPFVILQIILISGGFVIVSCYLYKRGGFLAPVTLHLSQYLLYHGLYGGIRVLL